MLALVLSTTALPAHGQAPDDVAWWFAAKSHALPVAPPAPPNVPAGGLYVQQDPDGPAAIGALRANVDGATGVTLTLQAAQGSTTTLGAPVQACATTSPWQPELPAPGYWEDRPEATKTCVPGTVSTDGAYVAFHFGSAFVSSGVLDVVLLPAEGATPFAIAFDPPAPDSMAVETAPATGGSTAYEPPPEESPSPATDALASPPFTVAGPTSQVSPSTTAVPAANAPVAAAPTLVHVVGGDADRGERVLACTGASLLIVGWWLLSTRRTRPPRRVGALAGGAVAPLAATRTVGIGRFARPRDGAASALR